MCGDQSAGKSSVLEGITGLPFPRRDGVCTRFATEIMLTHTEYSTPMVAEIVLSPSRSEDAKRELATYRREFVELNDLLLIIVEAGTKMGVRNSKEWNLGSAFASDILRVRVSGPIGLHLSIVDLPGLIAVANQDQTDTDV